MQCNRCPYRRGTFGHRDTHIQGKWYEETHGEMAIYKPEGETWTDPSVIASQGANPEHTWSQTSASRLGDKAFLLLKLWAWLWEPQETNIGLCPTPQCPHKCGLGETHSYT